MRPDRVAHETRLLITVGVQMSAGRNKNSRGKVRKNQQAKAAERRKLRREIIFRKREAKRRYNEFLKSNDTWLTG